MTAFNVVRMRVKPGFVDEFLKFHREEDLGAMPGMKALTVVRTGERDFCFIGEWTGMDALAAARPAMIADARPASATSSRISAAGSA